MFELGPEQVLLDGQTVLEDDDWPLVVDHLLGACGLVIVLYQPGAIAVNVSLAYALSVNGIDPVSGGPITVSANPAGPFDLSACYAPNPFVILVRPISTAMQYPFVTPKMIVTLTNDAHAAIVCKAFPVRSAGSMPGYAVNQVV